jgi:hypothetical protein
MKPKIVSILPSSDDQKIRTFLRSVAGDLPEDYVRFIAATNGGKPEPGWLEVPRWGGIAVRYFYGFGGGTVQSLEWALKVYDGRIPKGYMPIAAEGAGNQILLCHEAHNYGQCFLWDHEQESNDGEIPSLENLHLISSSFEGLMSSFKEPPVHSFGPLSEVFKRMNEDEVKTLLKSGWDVNSKLEIGERAILRVVLAQPTNMPILALLVNSGADLSGALHKSIMFENIEAMEYLIACGANLEEVNNMGNTPLLQATVGGKVKSVRLLVRSGANLQATNKAGKTAFELASMKAARGEKEMEGLLDLLKGNLDR